MTDMPLIPDTAHQMKLRALRDEIQQTNYVLYCLRNILIHDKLDVQMPATHCKNTIK
jgi:hypothetical protein